MKYLIDTHTFLWFGTEDDLLPSRIHALIQNPDNDIRISIASFWEIGIKNSIGKLPLNTNILGLEQQAHDLDIEILPITIQAIHQVTSMPSHHKDPFDRIIAATALTMGETLLSADTIFDSYGVSRLWE
ncbi:MAG: PilT protein domain protein [Capsulimonas sp.]|nr:PilT protein domain protein [Capsulimonas sp.]